MAQALVGYFLWEIQKYWVFADGAHCGHMIQYFLNILTICWAGYLQTHCLVYSKRTQHVLIQGCVGILDMEPPCTKHVLTQYRGVCPQWWYHLGTGGFLFATNDLTIINTTNRTWLDGPLTSDDGSNHLMRRQWGGIHIKEHHRSLEERSQFTTRRQFKLHSHLLEHLLLNILHTFL